MRKSLRFLFIGTSVTILTGASHTFAEAINPVLDDSFTFKLGVLQQELDGDITVNRPPLPETPLKVDELGVDDKATNPWAAFHWRLTNRWALNLLYNRFDEDGSASAEKTFNFDGVEYPLGAQLDTGLTADAYILDLSYAFFKSDRSELGAGPGLHAFDLETRIAASIRSGDADIDIANTSEDLIAPVPNLRLYGIYAINSEISLRLDGGWLSLTYGDYDGSFVYASGALEYRFTQHFGAGIGYQFTSIELEYESGASNTDFDFEFNGAQVYLTYSF